MDRWLALLIVSVVVNVWSSVAYPQLGTSSSLPLGGIVQLEGRNPIAAEIEHDVTYHPTRPASRRVEITRLRVDAPRVRLALFGGTAAARAFARVLNNKTTDTVVSLTLARINVREAMTTLELPRAGELEGLAGGAVSLEMHGGVFTQASVRIEIEEQTAFISRDLLAQLLGFQLNPDLLKQFNETMDQNFGTSRMLPLEGMMLEGSLREQVLRLQVPIRNRALEVTLEPRIEGALLWDAWTYIRRRMDEAGREPRAAKP